VLVFLLLLLLSLLLLLLALLLALVLLVVLLRDVWEWQQQWLLRELLLMEMEERRRGGLLLLLLLLVEVFRIPNQPLAAWNAFQTFIVAFRALVPNGRMLDTHTPLLAFITIQTSDFPWKLRGHWSGQRQVKWTTKDFLPTIFCL
jgi:hypothetical protein